MHAQNYSLASLLSNAEFLEVRVGVFREESNARTDFQVLRCVWSIIRAARACRQSRANQAGVFAAIVVEAGKNGLQILRADVVLQDFPQYRPKVRRQRKVAALIELVRFQPGPLAVHVSA